MHTVTFDTTVLGGLPVQVAAEVHQGRVHAFLLCWPGRRLRPLPMAVYGRLTARDLDRIQSLATG